MSDQRLRDLGVHIEEATPMHDFDDLVGRARRRVVARRAGAIATVVAASAAVALGVAQVGDQKDETSPSPADRTVHGRATWCAQDTDSGCVDISGWIAHQNGGIWALDPGRPDDAEHVVQPTDQRSPDPLEWGPVGRLSVLHADGTTTVVAADGGSDGSFSPDGSQVVYTPYGDGGG